MEKTDKVVILITTADAEEARCIAELLLNRKLAACVNVVADVKSMFWWQDRLETAQEALMIVKSTSALLSEVVATVKEAHSYDVPEIIALAICGGNEDYLNWIDNTDDNQADNIS